MNYSNVYSGFFVIYIFLFLLFLSYNFMLIITIFDTYLNIIIIARNLLFLGKAGISVMS